MKMAPGILAAHLQCILSADDSAKGETIQPLHVYLQHPAHTPESSCRYASALALLPTFQQGLQTACNKTLSNLPVSSDIPTWGVWRGKPPTTKQSAIYLSVQAWACNMNCTLKDMAGNSKTKQGTGKQLIIQIQSINWTPEIYTVEPCSQDNQHYPFLTEIGLIRANNMVKSFIHKVTWTIQVISQWKRCSTEKHRETAQ